SRVEVMSRNLGAEVFIRQQRANGARPDISGSLRDICCPVWVIGGEEDVVAPVSSQYALAAEIPGARLHMLPSCGHLSTLEQPAAINALLRRWLQFEPDAHAATDQA